MEKKCRTVSWLECVTEVRSSKTFLWRTFDVVFALRLRPVLRPGKTLVIIGFLVLTVFEPAMFTIKHAHAAIIIIGECQKIIYYLYGKDVADRNNSDF